MKRFFSVPTLYSALAHSRLVNIWWHSTRQAEGIYGRQAVTTNFWSESLLTNPQQIEKYCHYFLNQGGFCSILDDYINDLQTSEVLILTYVFMTVYTPVNYHEVAPGMKLEGSWNNQISRPFCPWKTGLWRALQVSLLLHQDTTMSCTWNFEP